MRNSINKITLIIILGINIFNPFNSIIAPIVNLFFLFLITTRKGKLLAFSNFQKYLIKYSSLLLLLSVLISLANLTFDPYVLGKFLRSLINTILLCLIINNLNFKKNNYVNSLVLVFFLNTLAVIIQYYFPQTKLNFALFSDFNRNLDQLRSFGLFSSYDATGLLTCISMLSVWCLYRYSNKIIYLLLFFTFFLSSIYISRVTMLVASFIFLCCVFDYLLKNNIFSIKIIFLLMTLIYLGNYVFNQIHTIIFKSIVGDSLVNKTYSSSSGDILMKEMLYFPDSLLNSFMGTGVSADGSDIGYVKIIFMIGIFGLFLIVNYYYQTYKKLMRIIKQKFSSHDLQFRSLKFFLVGFIVINFIFNFKLLLIYSRGFHELYLLLILGFEKIYTKQFKY